MIAYSCAQLWDMGQTPEEVSSLGLKNFPDEFKGFKGNHIQKVESIVRCHDRQRGGVAVVQ